MPPTELVTLAPGASGGGEWKVKKLRRSRCHAVGGADFNEPFPKCRSM